MSLPPGWENRLRIPLVVAPMTDVSTSELVVAAATNGVVGTIPTHNIDTHDLLATLLEIERRVSAAPGSAPWGANLIVHRSNRRRDHDVAALAEAGVEFVIASVGSPAPVVGPLHETGALVFADVATMRHVELAVDAGVDGLVALCAGAGGQTGALNPFAFVRAIRAVYDGPVALAGGIADGIALRAACAAGADLGYVGTRFIATQESGATPEYAAALVEAGTDDVVVDTSLTGLPANVLRASAGTAPPPAGFDQQALLANRGVWSAGHGVGAVRRPLACADVVAEFERDFG